MTLMSLARYEQQLKWVALGLGILSTIAIIRDWYPWTMHWTALLPDLGLLRLASHRTPAEVGQSHLSGALWLRHHRLCVLNRDRGATSDAANHVL